MPCQHDDKRSDCQSVDFTRRKVLQAAAATSAVLALPRELLASLSQQSELIAADKRFPYFKSVPVSYFDVRLQDGFWARRHQTLREVSVPWATRHFDSAGGVDAFRQHPKGYTANLQTGDFEAIKFIESMATVVGLQRDAAIEGLTRAWAREMIAAQAPDGYWSFGWPFATSPEKRWKPVWWSEEDYALGHYLESAIAFRESTGDADL